MACHNTIWTLSDARAVATAKAAPATPRTVRRWIVMTLLPCRAVMLHYSAPGLRDRSPARMTPMAQLVAAFGTSHSPMLASRIEDWQTGFLARDKARQFVDFDGNACDYDTLLRRAPADALERIAPEHLTRRRGEAMAAMARLRDDVAAARLDALIIVGDDQEELFQHDNMPAIGIYYGQTIRGRLPYQKEIVESDYPCDAALARHLIAALQQNGFDLSVMRSLTGGRREGHAFSFVHRFY